MLTVTGFTSAKNAHAHLLKHVLRLVELPKPARESDDDPERWQDVLGLLLAERVGARRSLALRVLRGVPGCRAGDRAPTSGRPCDLCQDSGVQHVISYEMKELLSAYVAAARAAVVAAFAAPDRQGPRLVAYQVGDEKTLETTDSRHVRVVGRLSGESTVAIVTCYRDDRSLVQRALEQGRLRAAHRRAGTLIEIPS